MIDPEKLGYKKAHDLVWQNKESGFYYIFIDNNPWLIHEVSFGEAAECGMKKDTWEFYTAENEKLKAKRKKEYEERQARQSPPPPQNTQGQSSVEGFSDREREQEDMIEAGDIHLNSDLVLQYEAEFTNRKSGEKTVRKWLSVNAWKLGLIEGYIKQGFSCSIDYSTEGDVVKCVVKLKKGEQEVASEGVYTKTRLKSFLASSKDECFETFAFRNAIRKIVSLKDVVKAVKEVRAEIQEMGVLPTKQVRELGE